MLNAHASNNPHGVLYGCTADVKRTRAYTVRASGHRRSLAGCPERCPRRLPRPRGRPPARLFICLRVFILSLLFLSFYWCKVVRCLFLLARLFVSTLTNKKGYVYVSVGIRNCYTILCYAMLYDTLYTIQCTLYTLHYTLYSIYYTLYTICRFGRGSTLSLLRRRSKSQRCFASSRPLYVCIYIYIYICICIERERDIMFIHVYMYVYIYIYMFCSCGVAVSAHI